MTNSADSVQTDSLGDKSGVDLFLSSSLIWGTNLYDTYVNNGIIFSVISASKAQRCYVNGVYHLTTVGLGLHVTILEAYTHLP